MPTYEYKCGECGDVFEEIHGIDEKVDECPACGGPVRRVFHPVGVIFKGSGFYKTDYKAVSDNGGDKASPGKSEKVSEKAKDKSPENKGKASGQKDAGSPS